jgi:Predicted hydrolase of the metallo-beta-lactamase superfamily
MNLNLYGWGDAGNESWVMIDLGVTFGGPEEPGIDLIMPDISFIEERRDRLLALVLTHAHEDHIGAVAHLWERLQCPIYATPFTAMLVEAKLREQGLPVTMINRIKTGDAIRIGSFDIQYMAITHSIPESHLLGIKTPAGRIVHTGDWKFDPGPCDWQSE